MTTEHVKTDHANAQSRRPAKSIPDNEGQTCQYKVWKPTSTKELIPTPGTPAYRAKVKRQRRQCEQEKEMTRDLTNLTDVVVSETITVG